MAEKIKKSDFVVRTPKSWERVCEVCLSKTSVVIVAARKAGA